MVRLVVLNHNGGVLLERCVASLLAQGWPSDRLDLVVIDNASTDGSADAVAAAHAEVRLLRSLANTGFPANNLALTDLEGIDFIGLVNNDAAAEPGYLAALVDGMVASLAADARVGAVCPKVLLARPEGEVDIVNSVGCELLAGGWARDRGYLEVDDGQFDEPAEVFAWSGAGVLLRPEYLADVGLFEESFFLYYEDTDLAWRGRARGWQYRTAPAATLRHEHAASSGIGSPLMHHYVERNRLAMLARNAPLGLAVGAPLRFLLSTASYARRDLLMPLLRGRRPDATVVRSRLGAFGAYLRMLPALLPARRRLHARATVPATTILSWQRRHQDS